MFRRLTVEALACSVALALVAAAQSPASPSRIDVRIYVSLSDSATRYFPVAGHRLIFFRSTHDSSSAVTDASGAVTVSLPPGEYRLVSAAPVEWHGFSYSWNAPIVVRRGMQVIDLRAPDATGDASIAVGSSRLAPNVNSTAVPASSPAQIPRTVTDYPKDPGTAFLLSFLITGGGQIYAGDAGKGVTLLVLSGVGAGLALAGVEANASCVASNFTSTCDTSAANTEILVGLGTCLTMWVYSMADAGNAARHYNATHAVTVSVRPTFTPSPRGNSFGLAFALHR